MSERKTIPYRVLDRLTGDVAYVRASSKMGACREHIIDRLDARPLTIEESLKLTQAEREALGVVS